MNQVAIREPIRNDQNKQKLMLLDYMADKYSLTADEFRRTVRATCGLTTATPEQVAAFLIVAKEYNLNPLTKEIYAFPGRGGGVVPIVSIDGWVNLVNSHPQCDGFEFAKEDDGQGQLYAFQCTMHRKDRKHPTVVTEYLSECARQTEPWKMKHRMLRHKSFIQAARYAFGFAGIYDEDEGRVIAEAQPVDVTPRAPVPSAPAIEGPRDADKYQPGDGVVLTSGGNDATVTVETRNPDPITSGPQPSSSYTAATTVIKKSAAPSIETEYDGWFSYCLDKITHADDGGWLETFFNDEVEAERGKIFPSDFADLQDAFTKAQNRLNAED